MLPRCVGAAYNSASVRRPYMLRLNEYVDWRLYAGLAKIMRLSNGQKVSGDTRLLGNALMLRLMMTFLVYGVSCYVEF